MKNEENNIEEPFVEYNELIYKALLIKAPPSGLKGVNFLKTWEVIEVNTNENWKFGSEDEEKHVKVREGFFEKYGRDYFSNQGAIGV